MNNCGLHISPYEIKCGVVPNEIKDIELKKDENGQAFIRTNESNEWVAVKVVFDDTSQKMIIYYE